MNMTYSMMRLVQVVLILGALEGFLFQKIQVFQIPEIYVTIGSDATLPCTYNVSGVEEANIGSYKWYRHIVKTGPEVDDNNKNFSGRISRVDTEQFIKNRSANITIQNVVITDAGTYYCEVSFLHGGGISGNGNGTLLNVTAGVKSSFSHSTPIYLGAAFGVVVVVLLVVGCYRVSKQAPRSTVEAGPIVYTEFTALGSRPSAPCRSEMLQSMETSHYMMENQQYNQFLPVNTPHKPGPSIYQGGDVYSIIP